MGAKKAHNPNVVYSDSEGDGPPEEKGDLLEEEGAFEDLFEAHRAWLIHHTTLPGLGWSQTGTGGTGLVGRVVRDSPAAQDGVLFQGWLALWRDG